MKNSNALISYTLQIGVLTSALFFFISLFFPTLKLFGIYILLATPIARVALSIVLFALQKNRLYVWITTIVLINLLVAIILLPFMEKNR